MQQNKIQVSINFIQIQLTEKGLMEVRNYNRRTFHGGEQLVSQTIDQILTKGGERLYDKYIYTKVPKKCAEDFDVYIQGIFNPVVNNNVEKMSKKIHRIHQSLIEKITIADQYRKNKNANQNSRFIFRNSSINEKSTSKVPSKRRCQKEQQKRQKQIQQKQQPNNQLELVKLDQQIIEKDQQSENIWLDKILRSKKQFQQQKVEMQRLRQAQRLRQSLQNELHILQDQNKTIAFDKETCKIIEFEYHKNYDKFTIKNKKQKIPEINFFVQQQRSLNRLHQPLENNVFNQTKRKVMSFERKKEKISMIDQEQFIDDASYNNNGERQKSTIPYLEIEQGVKITQLASRKTLERPQTSRKIGSAATQRTFKSYTKGKLETAMASKTIQFTNTDIISTRYRPDQKQSKRTSSNSIKRTILMESKNGPKNHKIIKNCGLFNNFFDFSTIE